LAIQKDVYLVRNLTDRIEQEGRGKERKGTRQKKKW
jgi:hypothetical protein